MPKRIVDSENPTLALADPIPKKRTAGGVATTDVTVSAYVAGNAEVFPHILII